MRKKTPVFFFSFLFFFFFFFIFIMDGCVLNDVGCRLLVLHSMSRCGAHVDFAYPKPAWFHAFGASSYPAFFSFAPGQTKANEHLLFLFIFFLRANFFFFLRRWEDVGSMNPARLPASCT
jgi:hypothetical protein